MTSTSHNAPQRFHLLAKPAGATCNLACSYCFYLDKEQLYPNSKFRMSDEVLRAYIRQLIAAHNAPDVTVAWQGGEPTLMGLDFYRRAIALQEEYRKPGMRFENTMQTNGTLLDDEWCAFLKENDYLIGISIDGPGWLHDAYRVDKGGGPTFDRVMRGLRLLQQHGVEHNVLVTVNRTNADHPLEVYRFLRDEAKATWIQFIPVVERVGQTRVSERSVQPEQFGRFLIQIFDEWVRHDVGRVYVQTFEAAVRNWLGMPTSGMCVFEETCGLGLALEHNGDVYSCDHFVEPDYRLGNILAPSGGGTPLLQEMLTSERQRQFGLDKRDTLPRYCLECDVRFACHGECPKNRFIRAPRSSGRRAGKPAPGGEPGLNYLCVGWMAFFHRIDQPLQLMKALMRMGRPAAEIMPILAREEAEWQRTLSELRARKRFADPCPCGSGLKFSQCHAWDPAPHGRTHRRAPRGRPRPPVRTGATGLAGSEPNG